MAQFINWFFFRSPANIFKSGWNFLEWGWQAFSIGYFVPRLFAPWHRDITGYGRGFDLKRWLHVFGWNLISRFIGAAMRLVVMAFGLIIEFLFICLTVFLFVFWILMPFIIPALIVLGVFTLFI